MEFTALHQQSTPLLLANVWDVVSARVADESGYIALGTSSAAIAESLGYPDGETLTFSELFNVVSRIRKCVNLPLSVDMEYGYGESPDAVIENLIELAHSGVVGVNLEDSQVIKNVRHLDAALDFARRIQAIKQGLNSARVSLFINVRTDTYLLNQPNMLEETIVRGQLYAQSGADGFFVPGLTQLADIRAVAQPVPLSLNVMCMPGLPCFEQLAESGVKRISMGNLVHTVLTHRLRDVFQIIQQQQSFSEVFRHESE